MGKPGSPVNQTMHKGITGSLLYLTASKPDIVFRVGFCASFQSNPKESYLRVAEIILRCLKRTQDMVLYYPSGYLVDRKNTPGMAHSLGSCLISWGTRKQNSMALSMAEAEYVEVASYYAQLSWIKQ
ncbi:secreted RxLR effector protein 161-like [Nicotiana sylvestris]|uniref:secreted RxLR effector protein 161-like n=1 Tax=Nicotiana sylvestris TaxID=4096 RepID=UPI00388C5015